MCESVRVCVRGGDKSTWALCVMIKGSTTEYGLFQLEPSQTIKKMLTNELEPNKESCRTIVMRLDMIT